MGVAPAGTHRMPSLLHGGEGLVPIIIINPCPIIPLFFITSWKIPIQFFVFLLLGGDSPGGHDGNDRRGLRGVGSGRGNNPGGNLTRSRNGRSGGSLPFGWGVLGSRGGSLSFGWRVLGYRGGCLIHRLHNLNFFHCVVLKVGGGGNLKGIKLSLKSGGIANY